MLRSASVAIDHIVNGSHPIRIPSRNMTFYTLVRYTNLLNQLAVAAVRDFWPSASPKVFYAILYSYQNHEEELQRRFGATLVRHELVSHRVESVMPQ